MSRKRNSARKSSGDSGQAAEPVLTPVTVSIESMALRRLEYREVGAPQPSTFSSLEQLPTANLQIGARIEAPSRDVAILTLTATFRPDPKVRPMELIVEFSGIFRRTGDTPTAAFVGFLAQNAAAILFPYVREIITSVTMRGIFGVTVVNPTAIQPVITPEEAAAFTKSLDSLP